MNELQKRLTSLAMLGMMANPLAQEMAAEEARFIEAMVHLQGLLAQRGEHYDFADLSARVKGVAATHPFTWRDLVAEAWENSELGFGRMWAAKLIREAQL